MTVRCNLGRLEGPVAFAALAIVGDEDPLKPARSTPGSHLGKGVARLVVSEAMREEGMVGLPLEARLAGH